MVRIPRPLAWSAALLAITALAPSAAFADSDVVTAANVWSQWDLSPDIVIPTLLALGIYAAGLNRRPGTFEAEPWRAMAYIWGVGLVFLSLASPADALSDHLFFMHQVQHMLLRMVGPMLVALSQPQAVLIAGLPGAARRWALAPAAGAAPIRAVFGFLTRPVTATILFIASLYVWQWPPAHNLAILNEGVHYVMHVTMLMAGLLFFWRVFDQRPAPKGSRYGVRLMMLWVAVLASIPIGAYTTFKSQELYPAYDVVGRLFHIAPMTDEGIGGFIMWAPSNMMMLLAVLVVIHAWGRNEERTEGRRAEAAARLPPVPPAVAAAALAGRQRPKNRALALGLAAFAVCILAATLSIGLLAVGHAGPGRSAMAQAGFGAAAR